MSKPVQLTGAIKEASKAIAKDIAKDIADETQQQILACLKRIECMLKDEEDERLRAKRELRDRMTIYQGKPKEDDQCL